MDKSRDLKMNKSEKNNLYQKSPKTARMEKKKNSNIFLSNKKSKENNINFNKTGIQNKAKLKNNQKLVLNYPESNKNIEKERKLSSRNAKNKNGISFAQSNSVSLTMSINNARVICIYLLVIVRVNSPFSAGSVISSAPFSLTVNSAGCELTSTA